MSARIKVSRAGIELIKAFEGFRRRAARLPDGRWTVGYGHTVSAREGAEVSEADAEVLLIFDLLPVIEAVEGLVCTPLNQNQFDALVAFAFNIGLDAFRHSSVLAYVNRGRLTEAAMALEGWREATLDGRSVVLDPLVRRRAAEKALFLSPPGGPFAAPSALIRPAFDARADAFVPSGGLGDVEIPFDGPVAGVRVIVMPEPEPEPEPEPATEIEPASEPLQRFEEQAANPPVETPPGEEPAPIAPASSSDTAPARVPAERAIPVLRAFLYAPYANLTAGPLPLGPPPPPAPQPQPQPPRGSLAPEASGKGESAAQAVSQPAEPELEPTPSPVIAAPLNLPPRPAEPDVPPEAEPAPSTPSPATAPGPLPAVANVGGRTAEALVLTPPPEQDTVPGAFGPLRDPEPASPDDEPVLFEAEAVRVVRHEAVAEEEEPEAGSDPSGRWVLLAGIGIVAWAGAMAAFLRQNDYSGRAMLAPETVAWSLAVVGAACLSVAAYFLLKRLGGVRD